MRLHQYYGKENGLMVIGSASELRKLGEQLQAALASQHSEFSDMKYPPTIASVHIPSTRYDFTMSFHLDTETQHQPASNFPGRVWGRWIVLLLAIVGVASILRSLAHIFQHA